MSIDEPSSNDLNDLIREASKCIPAPGSLIQGLEISLREAMFGGTRQILVKRLSVCPTCQRKGKVKRHWWLRSLSSCLDCHETGTIEEETQLTITIPPKQFKYMILPAWDAVFSQTTTWEGEGDPQLQLQLPLLKIAEEGHVESNSNSRGDLHIALSLTEDPNFLRYGAHLFSFVEINQSQADLGGELIVDTLDGLEQVQISSASKNDESDKILSITLEGRGLFTSVIDDSRGQHLINLVITENPKPHPPPRFT